MAVTYRFIRAEPDRVFAVLAEGWLYPVWVVGASRMRAVDSGWPSKGARLHHSVGVWPLVLDDTTTMVEWDPPRRARLRARGWPLGEAEVTIEVRERPGGCLIRMAEDAVAGPGRGVPRLLRARGIALRNRESLRRLGYLIEGGAGEDPVPQGEEAPGEPEPAVEE